MEPTKDKRPLCVTFGSPLIGDQMFQQAMSQSSNLNSCFLHVASLQDRLISSSISNHSYSPFGIFLLCSDFGSCCFESPVSVLRLLNLISQLNQGLQNCDYGSIVENLYRNAICKDSDCPNISHSNLLQKSLALQLCALGFPHLLQETDMKNLVEELNKQELLKQKKRFIPNKKLDEMKTNMAKLEWYKKISKTGAGYYDRFKDHLSTADHDVVGFIRELNNYWKEMVEEAEKQPQKEGATFRTRWLYAGTNYRRMVEPLDVARYYKDGKRDYINQGRSEHYKQLEKWLENDQKSQSTGRTNNVESILTLDSCFWAHVEEALILCQKVKAAASEVEKKEAMSSLDEFEKYVYELLKNYAVSPEIFLDGSSFMRWWGEYFGIKRASYASEFANFMKNPINYKKYVEGAYNFP
ncbi:senescence-associated carboxylesterase 101 isoform X1 [Neltuma alba]|uniref:senescence-associated carboxylesterase 101 isoform X1 n=1 Tax=Neltuma alba TaxID=207710 RepID=UPI0010A45893|nr:senescence-associated carboxylesterase 101-like isoform X1 [Prosopis alba]XP_028754195.1 senescence-associated carboxylesterase 101-like isoform X1 [Prosopis alba]